MVKVTLLTSSLAKHFMKYVNSFQIIFRLGTAMKEVMLVLIVFLTHANKIEFTTFFIVQQKILIMPRRKRGRIGG